MRTLVFVFFGLFLLGLGGALSGCGDDDYTGQVPDQAVAVDGMHGD